LGTSFVTDIGKRLGVSLSVCAESEDYNTELEECRFMHGKKLHVLMVDDCETDRELIGRSLREISPDMLVTILEDGERSIEYLSGIGAYSDRSDHPFPDVLILDVEMPRVSGFEVLEWLRDRNFEGLQTIVLSGTDSAANRKQAKSLGAHVYLIKNLRPLVTAQALARLLRDFTPPR
jgi:CheY-like chemotaxis protein